LRGRREPGRGQGFFQPGRDRFSGDQGGQRLSMMRPDRSGEELFLAVLAFRGIADRSDRQNPFAFLEDDLTPDGVPAEKPADPAGGETDSGRFQIKAI
jgi:hypothetical protein